MSTQSPLNNSQSEPASRTEDQKAHSAVLPWMAGIVLILLGGAFLLQNMGLFTFSLDNWWALFILIPSIGSFETALRLYRSNGNVWTAPVRSAFLVGVLLLLVTGAFLFNFSWRIFGPVLMFLAGAALLANFLLPRKE